MKKFLVVVFALVYSSINAQKNCEYNTNVTDSIGSYKSTKEYLVQERIFGNTQKSMFFSLANTDGLLSLSVQLIQKSPDFISALCFDENSKIYFQLANGKVVTVLGIDKTNCGTSVFVENNNCRILTGNFVFMKDTFQDLKDSPIVLVRIKFASEMVDYIFKSELISELDKNIYHPETYFNNYLKCIE
jgi:hypothetical protein